VFVPIFRAHSHLQMHDVSGAVPYISCAAPEQSMHRWFPMEGRYSPTWRPTCRQENYSLFRSSQRLPWVLPRWHKAVAAVGVEREGAAQVALAAEQPAGPVVRAERRGQLAERGQQVAQRRARPIQVRQAVA
jgi:hypothetical protein